MKIFGGYILAQRYDVISIHPFACQRETQESAIGTGIIAAREKYPMSEGYANHGCMMMEIPSNWYLSIVIQGDKS